MAGSPAEVYQLMAEVIYVAYLVVFHRGRGGMSERRKRQRIDQVLSWSPTPVSIPDYCVSGLTPGLVHPGLYFYTNFGLQPGYLVEFMEQWKEQELDGRLLDTSDPDAALEFKKFVTGVDWRGPVRGSPPNSRAMQRATLLHLVHPDSFEAILSVYHKNEIAERFAYLVAEPEDDVDQKLMQVRRGLEAELGRDFDFYNDGDVAKRWQSPVTELWDEFVGRAKSYVGSGRLDPEEINYKLDMGQDLAFARNAVLDQTDGWQDQLKHALRSREGHPIDFRPLSDFNQWIADYPEEALSALEALWSTDDSTLTERIHSFSNGLPRSAVRGATGNRANVVSVLLMGLDVEQYPPFRIGVFNEAYDSTGFGRPQDENDEAAVYEHALAFLDRFIDEADQRGLELRHPLDAQSVIWGMRGTSVVDPPPPPPNGIEDLAADVYLTAEFLQNIELLLEEKKQVIFQGPPGTGKTYVARKLARHLAGSEDRVTLVQLHPSYAYEDFVRGIRPTLTDGVLSFEPMDGPLLEAAESARADEGKHYLVIDEINRGNVAKVFGELYFLLEYRDEKMRLQYQRHSGETFALPGNLYIIGTMNTADRSIALVDLALRRRFNFIEFHPDEEPVRGVLRRWLADKAPEMGWVADVVDRANEKLADDRHAAIGPSYFMKEHLDEAAVERIWKHSVLPYIEERLFGEGDRLGEFDLNSLRRAKDPDGPGDVDKPSDA
ncbi:MAG: AAA family ATPase [Chloroflexi bacterium]|nr:AAA family ATPase [Chloroflexota bacterium]